MAEQEDLKRYFEELDTALGSWRSMNEYNGNDPYLLSSVEKSHAISVFKGNVEKMAKMTKFTSDEVEEEISRLIKRYHVDDDFYPVFYAEYERKKISCYY